MESFFAETQSFKIACFKHIEDAAALNSFLKSNHPPVCIVDGGLIVSIRQIQTAILNAISIRDQNKMQTKNIYLEIMRCLCPDGRLASALKYFNITEKTRSAVAITIEEEMPSLPHLSEQCDINTFLQEDHVNHEVFRKIYYIDDRVLETYSYDDIACATIAAVSSDLLHTRTV